VSAGIQQLTTVISDESAEATPQERAPKHGTQGTVVRAKHALDYGLVPDKEVHGGPARTTLWTYGMESRYTSSYMVQTRPRPCLEFLIVTPCIVHRSHGTLTSHCSTYYSLFIMNHDLME
jgi:hypothetical protein